MNTETAALGVDLIAIALDRADDPARAVSALMSAAATILQRIYGEEAAAELMVQGIDEAAAAWRAARAN